MPSRINSVIRVLQDSCRDIIGDSERIDCDPEILWSRICEDMTTAKALYLFVMQKATDIENKHGDILASEWMIKNLELVSRILMRFRGLQVALVGSPTMREIIGSRLSAKEIDGHLAIESRTGTPIVIEPGVDLRKIREAIIGEEEKSVNTSED